MFVRLLRYVEQVPVFCLLQSTSACYYTTCLDLSPPTHSELMNLWFFEHMTIMVGTGTIVLS